MLLYNRRLACVHSALTAMEALWFTPLFLLFWKPRIVQPLALYGLLLVGGLFWMAVVDGVGRYQRLERYYQPLMMALGLFSSVALLRTLLYPAFPLGDWHWLGTALNRITCLQGGPRPELVLVTANLFLWGRAIGSTSRSMTALGIATSFRWGFFLLIITATLYGALSQQTPPVTFAWLYFALGLLALSLSRSDEKAALSHSAGRTLPWSRLGQLLLLSGTLVLLTWGFLTYLPGLIHAILDVLASVLAFVVIGLQILLVLLWLMVFQVATWLRSLGQETAGTPQSSASLEQLLAELRRQAELGLGRELILPVWAAWMLRYLPFILLLGGGMVGVLWLLRRARRRARHEDLELAQREPFAPGELLRRGADQLRGLADMLRRYGLSRQLLEAISVQNIYINVSRIGAQRGHPRPKALPPDLYLATLIPVFAGNAPALERLAAAYMRVHYGDQRITAAELAQLQVDYQQLRRDLPDTEFKSIET